MHLVVQMARSVRGDLATGGFIQPALPAPAVAVGGKVEIWVTVTVPSNGLAGSAAPWTYGPNGWVLSGVVVVVTVPLASEV